MFPPTVRSLPRVQRLLMIQPRWLGDVLLCTPAVRVARGAFPDACIDFLTEEAGGMALAGNRHLDDVLVARPGVSEHWALIREIRGRGYDTVVGFRSTSSTAYLACLSGATRRIATRGRGPRNLAFTDLVPRTHPSLYVARQKLGLLAPLGIEVGAVTDLSLEIAIGEADRTWAREQWGRWSIQGAKPVIVVSAVARDPLKQWGAQRWAETADALIDTGADVMLTNGPGELGQVEEVVRLMRHRPAWNHGPTSPQRLAALCQNADLWVGNDGGGKHLAAAAGVPTLSVQRSGEGPSWTDTSPGSPHRFVEGPCVRQDLRGGLDALPVSTVLAAACEMLNPPSLLP